MSGRFTYVAGIVCPCTARPCTCSTATTGITEPTKLVWCWDRGCGIGKGWGQGSGRGRGEACGRGGACGQGEAWGCGFMIRLGKDRASWDWYRGRSRGIEQCVRRGKSI